MTILQLQDVSIKFNGAMKHALSNINYAIKQGDFVILLGSNGSGKSTLLKLLYKDHVPDSGEIRLLDKPMHQYPNKVLSSSISTLTQNCADSFFNSLTLYENYIIVKEAKNFSIHSHKVERKKLQTHLYEYNPNLVSKLDCTIDQFSGGERQALALAFCMLQKPLLLLLDEHTSALDPKSSEQIMQQTQKMVLQNNITCILTTHDLDIALRYGNRILILKDGEIFRTIDHQDKTILSKEKLITMYS